MTPFEEKILKEFDEYWFVSKKRTKGSTNAHRYEVKVFLKLALAQQREEIVKEIKEEFTYVPVDFYKPSPGAKKYYQEETINGFLDSLTLSVPEEKGDI